MQVLTWIEIGDNPPDWDSKNPFYLVCNKNLNSYNFAWYARTSKRWVVDNQSHAYLDPPPTHYAILAPP